jgi:hypothetical protein
MSELKCTTGYETHVYCPDANCEYHKAKSGLSLQSQAAPQTSYSAQLNGLTASRATHSILVMLKPLNTRLISKHSSQH